MRVLVVGSLPPPLTERARGLLAEVVRRREEGAGVEVLSPTPNTVAHHHIEVPGPGAALEVALAARGVDEVVVQIEPGFPFSPAAGRAGRTVGLGALAKALQRSGAAVTVRLHSVHDLPGGAGGRAAEALWALAARIEAGDEATLETLRGVLSPEAGAKLALAVPPLELGGRRGTHERLGGGAGLEAATELVRARAAGDRAVLAGGRKSTVGPIPLGEWVPRPGAGVPDWGEVPSIEHPAERLSRRAARAVLHAADGVSLTRPLARGVRVARKLARRY